MTRGICKDRVGERHGTVRVVSRAPKPPGIKGGNAMWRCKCDCGNEVVIFAHLLKRTQFCGKTCEFYKAYRRTEISEQRFGRLIAVEPRGQRGNHTLWLTKCDCGKEHIAAATHLLTGYVKSCGCLGVESRFKHGKSKTREYKTERYQAYIEAKRRATPTKKQEPEVLRLYEKAREYTKETGVLHEVDHIIPLQGKKVSGLHVIANLQILTRSENRKKSSSFDPDDIC